MTKPEITFEYYFNEYCGGIGGILDKTAFDKHILPAMREIKSRCVTATEADLNCAEVLQCACQVAEQLYLADKVGMLKSESIDGYSVTYSEGGAAKNLQRIILKHLAGTGLLYAGVE